MPVEVVRAAMLGGVNLHAKGYSACRVEIPRTYVAMLNAGPHADRLREGQRRGLRRPGADEPDRAEPDGRGRVPLSAASACPRRAAHGKAGIPVPGLKARDGLAAINGSNVIAAMGAMTAARRRALDPPGRDRRRDDPRSASGEHEALHLQAARAARLSRRGHLRRQPGAG